MTRPPTLVLQPAVTVTSNGTRLAVRLLTVSEKANVCTVLLLTEPALTCAVSYKPTRAARPLTTVYKYNGTHGNRGAGSGNGVLHQPLTR